MTSKKKASTNRYNSIQSCVQVVPAKKVGGTNYVMETTHNESLCPPSLLR